MSSDTDYLKSEAQIIPQMLLASNQTSDFSVAQDNRIELERVKQIQDQDYDELRSLFGIKGEFCVYFEDNEGNLVNISELTGASNGNVGIGSSKVVLYEDADGNKILCSKP